MFYNFQFSVLTRVLEFLIVCQFFKIVQCGSTISFPSIPSHADFYNSEKWKDLDIIPPTEADDIQQLQNLNGPEPEASNLETTWIVAQNQKLNATKSPWQWSTNTNTETSTTNFNERSSDFNDISDAHQRTIKFQVLDDTQYGWHRWPIEHANYYYGYNRRPGYEWVQLTRGNRTQNQLPGSNLYTSGSSNSNYYTTRYGNPTINHPKKLTGSGTSRFYDYLVPDAYKQKRFRLEIHPGFIAAPIAGLAAFGAAAALTSKPVLVELGLVNRPKPPYGHEKPHHFTPGWHGPPIINHATATATASATVNPVITGGPGHGHGHGPGHGPGPGPEYPYPQQPYPNPTPGPSFDNTQFPVLKPIDHGPGIGNPAGQTGGSGGDRPWWSPFAAIIPRLRIDDVQRD